MQEVVIITASGSGSRLASNIPKQFIIINNKPIIFHTIEQFYNYSSKIKIIVALNADYISYWEELVAKYKFLIKHKIVVGGETRFYSIRNALKVIDNESIVAVHDAVRPFVSINTIDNCFKKAYEIGNAVPCVKINDSIREIDGVYNKSVDRNKFVSIQTPQVFKSEIIKKAYEHEFIKAFTDDASVVEKNGGKINLIEGNRANFKITTSEDLKIANYLIKFNNDV